MSQTRTTTTVRRCDNPGCHESLTIRDTQPMTEQLAIELGSWLTVLGEQVTPQGIVISNKQFCSASCLADYVTPLIKEYHDAETRQLDKMMAPNTVAQGETLSSPDLSSWEHPPDFTLPDPDSVETETVEQKIDLEALQAIARGE